MFEVRIVIPGLELLAEAAFRYVNHITRPGKEGAKLVFKVTDDQKPTKFEVDVTGVTDAHGHPADPAKLVYDLSTTDSTIATVEADPDAPEDESKGVLVFTGEEGSVTVNANVEDQSGKVLLALTGNFIVTAGDPAAIATGSLKFEGLTEAPDVAQQTPNPTDTSGTPEAGTPDNSGSVIEPLSGSQG